MSEKKIDVMRDMENEIANFHLPRYREITDVGLFLEQTVRQINIYLEPFENMTLTSSMVSNYVKHKLVEHPTKKMYNQSQIAGLTFIAVAKTVLSLDEIREMLRLQRAFYSDEVAYDFFCDDFEQILRDMFRGQAPSLSVDQAVSEVVPMEQEGNLELKKMLHYLGITAAHRIHLEWYMKKML